MVEEVVDVEEVVVEVVPLVVLAVVCGNVAIAKNTPPIMSIMADKAINITPIFPIFIRLTLFLSNINFFPILFFNVIFDLGKSLLTNVNYFYRMKRASISVIGLGIVSGILSFAWSADHFPLYNLSFLPLGIRVFFVFDSILSIVAGILFILAFRLFTVKIIYLLQVVYWWINYLLLTLTRVLPAPLIGRPLPATTGPALIAFVLDILLIITSTALYIMIQDQTR